MCVVNTYVRNRGNVLEGMRLSVRLHYVKLTRACAAYAMRSQCAQSMRDASGHGKGMVGKRSLSE